MNTNFVIYDATGAILRTGDCPAEELQNQCRDGEFIIEAKACCVNDSVNPETGEIVHGGGPGPQPTTFSTPATESTGLSTQVQLDLLWQAMDAGTFPKAEPFYSAIKAQKDAAA